MVDGATQPDEVQLKLYGMLVDQLHKYTAILWQFPTAVVAANAFAVDKFSCRPGFIIAIAVTDAVFAYAFHRLVLRQRAIIEATRRAEARIGQPPYRDFIPEFPGGGLRAPDLFRVALWLLPVSLVIFALLTWCAQVGSR